MKYDHVPVATTITRERASVTSTVCGVCGSRAVRTVRHGHAAQANGMDQMDERHWQWKHEQVKNAGGDKSPWRRWTGPEASRKAG